MNNLRVDKQKTCIYCGNVVEDYKIVIFREDYREIKSSNPIWGPGAYKKNYILCNNCNQYFEVYLETKKLINDMLQGPVNEYNPRVFRDGWCEEDGEKYIADPKDFRYFKIPSKEKIIGGEDTNE